MKVTPRKLIGCQGTSGGIKPWPNQKMAPKLREETATVIKYGLVRFTAWVQIVAVTHSGCNKRRPLPHVSSVLWWNHKNRHEKYRKFLTRAARIRTNGRKTCSSSDARAQLTACQCGQIWSLERPFFPIGWICEFFSGPPIFPQIMV